MAELLPPEFLKVIGVWSLIPSYLVAGGVVGFGLDSWWGTFPFLTSAGLLFALVMAVRDMLRLREVFRHPGQPRHE